MAALFTLIIHENTMRHFIFSALITCAPLMAIADPLPSWNASDSKDRIIEFVSAVADPDSPDYVTPAERIAVFDNDGTLWAEQPVYFQLIFAMDRLAELAEQDASILTSPTLQAAAQGDLATVLQGGHEALIEVVNASHSGISVDAFQQAVADWLQTARHAETDLPYDQMTYQPMVELLRYLRD